MKAHIRTYGCQMNERDSEAVGALLANAGFEIVTDETVADVVIVNTCSVRAKAEDKALGKLHNLAASKHAHPARIIGVIGCMARRTGAELFEKVKGLDFVIGPRRLSVLPAVIESIRNGGGAVLDIIGKADEPANLSGHINTGIASFVTVVEGCSRGCTYCVVPEARGPETSRPATDIIEEIRTLVSAGVKEVTLLGQSVTSYGRKAGIGLEHRQSPLGLEEQFPRLLEGVATVPGLRRIRFASSHPSGVTVELARAMSSLPAICNHIHLPLQSGSDRILGLMRRGYSADEYREAVSRLRTAVPHLAITTDIIVGFPTETEADFDATRRLMEEIQFDNAYVFKYSPRPRTTAARWVDDVPPETKALRNQLLLEDLDRVGLSINQRLVGRDVEVLVEGESLRNRTRWSGRTSSGKIVIVEPVDGMSGPGMITVRIERAMPQTLYGTITGREKERA
ncbi:MAG: tRNA (N6-isopentenyl adenosine(37)-C2)-methylthiotransferase MiaB [bacterium]